MTTPFDERLSEILADGVITSKLSSHKAYAVLWQAEVRQQLTIGSKQAILSLFREMVEEAKPRLADSDYTLTSEELAYNGAIRRYEANLLQQLGEKE